MGNQLTATPTVDLANVSSDLELIAPLGAEGRNYFATFHCLHYTPLSSSTGSSAASTASTPPPPPPASSSTSDNAPRYSTDFLATHSPGKRSEYRPNSLYYPSNDPIGSPLMTGPSTRGGHGRDGSGSNSNSNNNRGLYAPAAAPTSLSAAWVGISTSTATVPTTLLPSRERAAWHQARWRQRLPVAARPWYVVPSHFVSEAVHERRPAGDAMDRWCRDSTVASSAFANSNAGRLGFREGDTATSISPLPSSLVTRSGGSSSSSGGHGTNITSLGNDFDSTVAGVMGEWRGNYGNYVQLLLRGGGGAAHNAMASAALCNDQVAIHAAYPTRNTAGSTSTGLGHGTRHALSATMTMTMPAALGGIYNSSGGSGPAGTAFSALRPYVMHDVVTKVFVRTPDDAGQAYFLKRVRQMMDNAGEQLSIVDSTLPSVTPRNCLWYTLAFEGDGFCVLQRPYVAFTLRERLTARPGWTAQEKLFIAFQLLQAVAHLHESYGLTHGDIKPNNVLVQSTGVVVLCDMAPFKPWRLPLDNPLLFDYYYDTDESRACYVAPEKFSDQPLPSPPLESKTPGSATYNVGNVNFDGHTAAMDVFSTACVLLFLYREEDPFTLSEMLNLHHLSSVEAREKAVLPVVQTSGVPPALQPLLQSMLCSASAERPSAREVLKRGLATHVFPACFPFLYEDVWPRLLTRSPDVRLRLFHNRLGAILQRCADLDGATKDDREADKEGIQATSSASVLRDGAACQRSPSHTTAVNVLLPLLLQTIHAATTSDEATFRGLLCLRQCTTHCSFDALADFVLPHLVYVVNDDAHVYGPPTRLLAIRLMCSTCERIARQLTAPLPSRSDERADSNRPPDEEQWTLLEHLVLPCLYDVLRQGEQESTAVLVELAEQLPRLLLLTRFLTERRQVLYGAEDGSAAARTANHRPQAFPAETHEPPREAVPKTVEGDSKPKGEEKKKTSREASDVQAARTLSPHHSSSRIPSADGDEDDEDDDSGAANTTAKEPAQTTHATDEKRRVEDTSEGLTKTGQNDEKAWTHEDAQLDAPGVSMTGAAQYLAQLRCLLTNGWTMLQLLYSHPCVTVAAAMMQQTSSTVAAFLGDERVAEDLIPLLTTALTAPLRVLRLLFPQAIVLHALLQKPQAKTLRLFVEEGLHHPDDVCLKSTLDSVAVVVRSRRLPLAESMALVHQTLPFLMESRLWLREAACGVVEAAAQSYPPSAVALHLEYAVRPLLTHPVPLAQLRRFAASIIRSELAGTGLATRHTPTLSRFGGFLSDERGGQGGEDAEQSTEWSLFDYHGNHGIPRTIGTRVFLEDTYRCGSTGTAATASWLVDYRDALPSVVAAVSSTVSSAAPALLHTLQPPSPVSTTTTTETVATPPPPPSPPLNESDEKQSALTYQPSSREATRIEVEGNGDHRASRALLPSRSATATSAALTSTKRESTVAPPYVVDLSPFPRTLPPHASLCRTDVPVSIGGGENSGTSFASSPSAFTTAARAATMTTMTTSGSPFNQQPPGTLPVSTSRYAALRPTAAPLGSVSAHMGAVYTAATTPSASGSGVVVTAGTRGEAFVWRVGGDGGTTTAGHPCVLTLVDRVPSPVSTTIAIPTTADVVGAVSSGARPVAAPRSAPLSFSYVASQWMSVAGLQRRDGSSTSAVAGTSNTVALASTDGAVRVLDVERNTWLWSTAVSVDGGTSEGTSTALALQDRHALLVTTAAGGLHVIDTRCRGDHIAPVWSARLDPLDGAPSSLLPLYTGDRACAAVVATYGGVVCLYDLRYQLCAQRGEVTSATSPQGVSITCACVDPLSSLCRSCRPPSWEPAVPGPSALLGTTAGTVYRLLLQFNSLGACWPVFQCESDDRDDRDGGGGGQRCMLAQPSKGSVFTGSEDGYIRHWSTDRPESSHTMTCVPYTSPPYAVTRSPLAAAAGAERNGERGGGPLPTRYGTKHLAALMVREVCGERGARRALPHHASDAVLTLCAVQTAASSSSSSSSASWSGTGDGHSYLLSGARDGSLTLWNNME